MISLFITICLVLLFYWGITRILAAFNIGEPISTVVQVLVVITLIIVVLRFFGVMPNL